jgi:predicted dehydrogenase
VDAVLIAASAKEDTIVSQAAQMSRKRGRIVLVGVVNTQINRNEFYAKELTFQVSCSYGPGRHDEQYERQGIDYPLPFVRWTARRNFEAVLELMAGGKLDVSPLITSRIPQGDAARAYELLTNDKSQLGIVFAYPEGEADLRREVAVEAPSASRQIASGGLGGIKVGVIGAGDFTRRTLLPALARTPVTLGAIASAGGLTAADAARKFGFSTSTTDSQAVLDDPATNVVFITTRHHQHAPMVAAALRAGKHVFVEKPLAIDMEGSNEVKSAFAQAGDRQLMVGFNRRFSPHAVRMRQLLATRHEPACAVVTVNAGAIPSSHWIHDPAVGGGRLIGEGCHWIDLLRFLLDSPIIAVQTAVAGGDGLNDLASVSLRFADGSLGTLHYFANGHRAIPKERVEVFCGGRALALDNFRVLHGYGWKGFSRNRLWRQDKGHQREIDQFIERLAQGGPPLIPPDELWNVTEASLAAECSARTSQRIDLPLR